jgi:hypothetical protein
MKIHKKSIGTAVNTTRRQVTGLLCGSGLLTLAGCGGGGSGTADTSQVAPSITLAPQSVTATEGQSFALTVKASGSYLTYQWKRNGVAVNGATGSSLQLTATSADSDAKYTVVVRNSAGQVESSAAVLTVISGGTISLLAGGLGAGASSQAGQVDGEGAQARFANMGASCVDQSGNVYVIDTLAMTLRKVTPTGSASTLFTGFPSDGGVAVDAQGYFYGVRNRTIVKVAPSGAQQVWAGQTGVLGFADGAGAMASFASPMGLVFDAQGNLLVGDSPNSTAPASLSVYLNYTYGATIRKITPAGVVSTIAGIAGRVFSEYDIYVSPTPFPGKDVTFIWPNALATDATGRIWVLDRSGVRRIDAQGSAPVWLSRDANPTSMSYAAGSAGDVYVARGHVIRKLSADGTQTVVAGVDTPDHEGVQLGALPGSLGQVTSIVNGAANVLYACSENSVLRIQMV